MPFLIKSDLSLSILLEELDEITRADNAIITQGLSAAEAEARAYLYDSYDTEAIFAAAGTARHAMVLQCCVDMAVYRIVAACQAGIDMSDRKERYDAAKSWFKSVAKMTDYVDLPRRTATKQTLVQYGSKPKRGNYF
jgi:phage gp36-like protein